MTTYKSMSPIIQHYLDERSLICEIVQIFLLVLAIYYSNSLFFVAPLITHKIYRQKYIIEHFSPIFLKIIFRWIAKAIKKVKAALEVRTLNLRSLKSQLHIFFIYSARFAWDRLIMRWTQVWGMSHYENVSYKNLCYIFILVGFF